MLLLRFRHIHGRPTTTLLRLSGRDYPLDLAGTAWVDPETGSIVRIKAGLDAPMDDIGLKAIDCDVRYAPMTLSAGESPHWLPSVATIEVATARQHWRNTHQFQEYRQFSIKSETTVAK
jgi:hypothetical protein